MSSTAPSVASLSMSRTRSSVSVPHNTPDMNATTTRTTVNTGPSSPRVIMILSTRSLIS